MQKYWINITFIIIISIPTLTVTVSGADFQTWSDIATIYKFNDRWRYDGDQGVRGVLSDSDFTLLYFRPSVRYRARSWFTVHGGIRFFKNFFDDGDDTFEIGPWQGLRFVWPMIGRYAISHYLRLEERMIWQTEGERDFDFTVRSRYQLGVRSPNYDILFKNGIYLTGSVELFWNLENQISDNVVNRIRYDVGAGTKVSDAWRVELHYVLQDGREIEDLFEDLFSSEEHILRLRLFYTFN
ncbi:MAG: DUF2490 domain-containing protein [Deltaproteobacteria bacterium]|nr:DUF2490 domain-containing protein [Deltaproteobacteria bacterium]